MTKCEEDLADPRRVLELNASAENTKAGVFWKWYLGQLLAVEARLQEQILVGEVSPAGEDLTPYLRFVRNLLLEVIALAEKPRTMVEEDERDFGVGPQTGPTQTPKIELNEEALLALQRELLG